MLLSFLNEVNFLCRQQNTKPLKISGKYYIMLFKNFPCLIQLQLGYELKSVEVFLLTSMGSELGPPCFQPSLCATLIQKWVLTASFT